MTPEEFRQHGKALIDWIADYWEALEDVAIVPDLVPGDIRAMLPDAAPEKGEPFADVLADLDKVVRPGLTHWQAPGWFAYFPANASFPAILGELAAAGLGQQGMLWATSPSTTELEAHVLDWLVDLLGLPQGFKTTEAGGGVLQMSASDSTHTALVVAREQARERTGASAEQMVAYASAQAHSSIEKGARVSGFGHVRLVDTEVGTHAMSPVALRDAMAADVARGLVPAMVCAAVGTTGTTAVDPVAEVAGIARSHDAWVHVDAAYAGSAMICPELRHHQEGLELVDSYTVNPHKWLLTNFDCSVFWVADREPLIRTMSILPPFLVDQAVEAFGDARGAAIDYRDWHVPLGRRFRALKLWFVLRSYGAEGLRAHIREHLRLAQWLAGQVAAHPLLELVAPTPFGLVSFAHVEGDDATQSVAYAVVASATSYLATSVIDGRRFIRVSIGSTTTRAEHVERLWDLIEAAA
jgi:aromatic-L-amino-acid decarboxylase